MQVQLARVGVMWCSRAQVRRFEHSMLYQGCTALYCYSHVYLSPVQQEQRRLHVQGAWTALTNQTVCLPCRWKSSKLMHLARSMAGDGAMPLAFSDIRSVGWISDLLLSAVAAATAAVAICCS